MNLPRKVPMMRKCEMVPDNTYTGIVIRKARKNSGVSLRKFATKMGISAMFLSDLERGRRNWTEKLFQLAVEKLKG